MKTLFVLTLLSILGFHHILARADSWDSYNDPSRFGSGYEYHFQALPLNASLEVQNRPWSESYWPRNTGSINIRWNTPGKDGFDYTPPNKAQVANMTRAQLAQLSPTEKYDLARGLYNYPLQSHVAAVNAYRGAHDYEGICDGWTASALQFKEPKAVDILNPDGISIPFGSSDVKALMSYHAAFNVDLGPIFAGRYCPPGPFGRDRCNDINPGTYHVILTNEIGLRHQAFASDIEIGKETWNQPIYGYEFEVRGSANSSAAKAYLIHAKLHYTDELEISQWEPVTGTDKFLGGIQESDYVLEMDSSNRITGGYWVGSNPHPDLFWKPTKAIHFTGDFEFLNKIYQPMN